jgi:predicted nucleic acid-binding Zn ribbon protein
LLTWDASRFGFSAPNTLNWSDAVEDEAIDFWWSLRRCIDELPLVLQAFVLKEDNGLILESGYPFADFEHWQIYRNMEILDLPESALREAISLAQLRIDKEIELVKEKRSQDDGDLRIMMYQRLEVGSSMFREWGPKNLYTRARQRYSFVFAAEEILDALISNDPRNSLETARYIEESGASIRSQLYVKDGIVQLHPPILFDFVMDVQVSRIRKCRVCKNYFWAGRKDKTLCSEKCAATHRKRQERLRALEIKIGDRKPKKRRVGPKPVSAGNVPRTNRRAVKRGK